MKSLKITLIFCFFFYIGLFASEQRDKTIGLYGVNNKVDQYNTYKLGTGIMYDSEDVKLKVEGTSDYTKLSTVLKFSPLNDNYYIKVGGNYIHQKFNTLFFGSDWVDQYSFALAGGYMPREDMYVEVGGAYTKLNGTDIGALLTIQNEYTSRAYIEVAKRWESDYGTLDTTANYGKVYPELNDNRASYGVGIDYYPTDDTKLSFSHQYEKDNIINSVSGQYKFLFTEYQENISEDTYQLMAGVKFTYDSLLDFSSWKAPTKLKSHLSELHKFEQMTFTTNNEVQSSRGIELRNDIDFTTYIQGVNFTTYAQNDLGYVYIISYVYGEDTLAGSVLSLYYDESTGRIVFDGSDMFFGQTGNPEGFFEMFQDFDWYSN